MILRSQFRTRVAIQLGRRLTKEEVRRVDKLRLAGYGPTDTAGTIRGDAQPLPRADVDTPAPKPAPEILTDRIRAALADEAYTRFTRADVRALLDEIDRLRRIIGASTRRA